MLAAAWPAARGQVEAALGALGFEVRLPLQDAALCCGSAGTYSVLQPDIAYRLRDRKLETLAAREAPLDRLGQHRLHPASAGGTPTPVRHWIEVIDELLAS